MFLSRCFYRYLVNQPSVTSLGFIAYFRLLYIALTFSDIYSDLWIIIVKPTYCIFITFELFKHFKMSQIKHFFLFWINVTNKVTFYSVLKNVTNKIFLSVLKNITNKYLSFIFEKCKKKKIFSDFWNFSASENCAEVLT